MRIRKSYCVWGGVIIGLLAVTLMQSMAAADGDEGQGFAFVVVLGMMAGALLGWAVYVLMRDG